MAEAETPRCAVLFKTHVWNDFAARQFVALQARCRDADLWVCADETHGPIADIAHDKVFRSTDSDMVALGLPAQPGISLNWYNVDYQLLAFHQAHANHAFYIMVEYDAVVQVDLDALAADALQRGIDVVAFPIRTPIKDWLWTHTLDAVWPREEMLNQLFCISGFSQPAVAHLLAVRREHAVRYARGEFPHWPFSEGMVPTALSKAGFTLENLSRYGSTDCYDWWPPYHESELPALALQGFVHPVLTGQRYVASLIRVSNPESYLEASGSTLRRQLDREQPHIVVPALIEAFVQRRNLAGLIELRQVVEGRGWQNPGFAWAAAFQSFVAAEAPCNLALHKFAYQSSVCEWSRAPTPAADAAGAVNGVISGDYGFHTRQELKPWWMVDLGNLCLINEIRVYNRLTMSERASHLSIWSSPNARDWELVYRRTDDAPFGGADGHPLVVPCDASPVARFIRIECDGVSVLHLDEVEIIGVTLVA